MFLFVVCVDYVYDVLGFGCYLICFWVSYCCEVWLIFGPGLEAGHCFRLVWYRLGLCLYRASSFFLSLSISFLFALFMIAEIALWHKEGMSYLLGG